MDPRKANFHIASRVVHPSPCGYYLNATLTRPVTIRGSKYPAGHVLFPATLDEVAIGIIGWTMAEDYVGFVPVYHFHLAAGE